jgi:hypothetical protein
MHAWSLLVVVVALVPATAALQIVIEILSSSPSDALAPTISLETINNALQSRNLSNATALNQRVIFLNASLLASCAPGYYHDYTTIPALPVPPCVVCNCTKERWIARMGGGVRFAPLDPSGFPIY